MNRRLKTGVLGIAAGTMLAATPAAAQLNSEPAEVRVGIIDVRADTLTFPDRRTSIEYREFAEQGKSSASWITESGADHGQVMASAFVKQLRLVDKAAKIRIYAANIFQENSSATGSALYSREGSKRTISMNIAGAKEALAWFKEKGVKVVLTAFNGTDTEVMRSFMKTADDYGMTVFASAGNKAGGAMFPAAYKQTISIAADNRDLVFRQEASYAAWVNFTMDGGVPEGITGGKADEGSSFATAKAAALGAYYAAAFPSASRDQIAGALGKAAAPQGYSIQGTTVSAMHLDEMASARQLLDQSGGREAVQQDQDRGRANIAAAANSAALNSLSH